MRARQPRRPTPRRLLLGALALLCILYYLFFSGAGTAAYDPAAHARPSSSSAHENKTLYSIIVPTYHERANIRPLVTRVFTALPDPAIVELVIVDDDSRDGTDNVVAELREEGFNVVLIVRTKEEQERGGKGLSGAVLRGFEEARGESLVVMDADLQHPPTALPALFSALDDPATPFALGTRYAPGVEMDQNWPLYRRVISWGARSLARPLTSASDPMTGFFGIRKELFLHSAPLTPTGFKIGLELLLKAPIPRGGVKEVPFSFGVREVGESKLSGKVMIRYVGQLWNLYWWAWGIFFPLALLAVFTTAAGIAFVVLHEVERRYGLGLYKWGLGWVVGDERRRRKIKGEV